MKEKRYYESVGLCFMGQIFALKIRVLCIFAKFVKSRYILLLILIKQSDRISVIFYREVR